MITDNRANGTPKPEGGTWGTSGSASVTISGAGFSARNLTFANDFDEAAHPEITSRQAVAVLTRADPSVMRWSIAVLIVLLLCVLASGWRPTGPLSSIC